MGFFSLLYLRFVPCGLCKNCTCVHVLYSHYHSRTRYQERSRVHCRVLLRVRSTSNNTKAMNEWCFPGIAFYYGNNEFIVWQTCRMIGSYVATPPGNKKSISNEQRWLSNDKMNEQEAYCWVEQLWTKSRRCLGKFAEWIQDIYHMATQRTLSVATTSNSSVRSTLRNISSGILVGVHSLATNR